MRQKLQEIIGEQGLFAPGERVLVALSGGCDSVALLGLLLDLAPYFSLEILAAHLDHAIRPESTQDADFVRRLCRDLGVCLTVARREVPAEARRRKRGLEETAREIRRDFLLQTMARHNCTAVALGHHREDQVETFLHRLLRGAGPTGLAAMRMRSGPFVRPLLPFSRRDLCRYLEERGRPWVEDASNRDPAFTRNRIRHQLLPRLRSFNPRVEEHLARLAGRLALEEDYWRQETAKALAALAEEKEEGILLPLPGLAALHPALRARVLRGALERVRGDLTAIDSGHIAQMEALLAGDRPQVETHLPGAWVGRRYQTLWLRRSAPAGPEPFAVQVPGPGRFLLPGGGCLAVTLADRPKGEESWSVEFDAGQVSFPLTVRTALPGDRMRPAGMVGRKKLKDLFVDAKLSREVRRRLPLVAAGEEVLWIPGVRRCAGLHPCQGGGVLRLEFTGLDRSTIHL